jgi:hypothetical protein
MSFEPIRPKQYATLKRVTECDIENDIITTPPGAPELQLIIYPTVSLRQPGLAQWYSHIEPQHEEFQVHAYSNPCAHRKLTHKS